MYDENDPNHDDFELWSPSESRTEACLFGRRVSTNFGRVGRCSDTVDGRLCTIDASGQQIVLLVIGRRLKQRSRNTVNALQSTLSGKTSHLSAISSVTEIDSLQ